MMFLNRKLYELIIRIELFVLNLQIKKKRESLLLQLVKSMNVELKCCEFISFENTNR